MITQRFLLLSLTLLGILHAAEPLHPPEVLHPVASAERTSPPATLDDLAWLVGAWNGPIGENHQEAYIFPAAAGHLPGFARGWTPEGEFLFSEANTFVEVDGTLEFRVKHFTAAFHGTEPRDGYERHRLLKREGDTWFFENLTLRRDGPNDHTVAVRIRPADGEPFVIVVPQQRVTAPTADQPTLTGTIETLHATSQILQDNRIGVSPERDHRVYLPPSYVTSPARRYPVVYFCHSSFWSPAQAVADGNLQHQLEAGFARGDTAEFILVIGDYTGPTTGSLYENSTTSGRWLDYTAEELVPLIDRTFRTLPRRESRALTGDFWGGRGALVLAMRHADVFGSAYALHPVATGSGNLPVDRLDIDWPAVHAASDWDTLPGDGRSRIFTAISQAFLPNPDRRPFYCDFPVELAADGTPKLAPANNQRMTREFLLDGWLDTHAEALRSLRGLALDWGRFDPTQAHVSSNRRFSKMLASLGVPHEAEEHAGGIWDRMWTDDGRFATRVLPFLGRHLAGADRD